MKLNRTLGLVAVGALVAVALTGATSASATVFCSHVHVSGTDCTAPYTVGTNIDASIEATVKLSSFGITLDTCTEGTLEGPISRAGSTSETVSMTVNTLTWGNCTVTTTTTTPGSLEFHQISGTNNATVTSSGMTTTANFAGSDCEFGTTNSDFGTLTGGEPATIDINGTVPEVSGRSGCPASGGLSGMYVFTQPKATLDSDAG